jgi:Tol biopolymer transport system component/DNA-binding winged helix-turn-helix (wHTH) protein
VKSEGSATRVHFGAFILDLAGRCLLGGGRRVRLTHKPFETLVFLVEHRHETVTKQQLVEAVWKQKSVMDGTLVQAIRAIRSALGDDDKEPRYIQTIPRVGYRFIGVVDPEGVEDGSNVPPAVARRAWPSRAWSIAAGAGVAAAVLAGFLWAYAGSDGVERRAPGLTPVRPLRQLTWEPLNALKPAYSPDGTRLLYVSSRPGVSGLDVFLMPAGGGRSWQLTNGMNASGDQPVFTPDGARVVFSRYRDGKDGTRLPDLWAVSAFGGSPTLFLAEASGAGFSPDGRRIAYTRHVGGRTPLWSGPTDRPDEHLRIADSGFVPRWSPDGRHIAYTTSNPEGGAGQVWTLHVASGESVQVTTEPEDVFGLAWAPDSRAVIVSSSRADQGVQLRQVPIDGGAAVPLTSGVGYHISPSSSTDGRLAFTYFSPSSILTVCVRPTDGACTPVARADFSLEHLWPRFSPSGSRVATVARLPDGSERLWVIDTETGERLRDTARRGSHPNWLDDDRVAFLSHEDADEGADNGAIEVLTVSSGAISPWITIGGTASGLAVHPSKTSVALVRNAPQGDRIVLLDTATGEERVVTSGGKYEGLRWHPDGGLLAWSGPTVGGGGSSNGIWVASPDAPSPRQVVKDGYGPAWSADGRALFYVRVRGSAADSGLWRLDLTSGAAAKVRNWGRVGFYDLVGERLLYAHYQAAAQIFDTKVDVETSAAR